MQRRNFIKNTATIAAVGLSSEVFSIGGTRFFNDKVRLGFIGVGARGLGTLELALLRKDITVTAICDIDPITTAIAMKAVSDAGQKPPKLFTDGPYAYKKFLEQKDVRVGLGGINHALLTLDALEPRKIPVVALVLNETAVLADPVQEEQQKSTVALLRERVSVPLLGPLPYQSCAECAWPDAVDAAADSLPIRELAELVWPRVAGRS